MKIEMSIMLTEGNAGFDEERNVFGKRIDGVNGFTGEYEFLSNDYPRSMEYRGKEFPDAASALRAIEWDGEDGEVLEDVLRAKFRAPELREKLLATFDDPLVTKEAHWERQDNGIVIVRYAGSPLGTCLMRLLDALIPSEEVRDHLKKQELDVETIQNLISDAAVPLEEKMEWLKLYSPQAAARIQEALNALELQPGERFRMYRGHFVPEGWAWRYYQEVGEFSSYRDVQEQIHQEDDRSGWVILEKEVSAGEGEYERTYTYYLAGDKIVYFVEDNEDRPPRWYEYSPNLHISLPFQPGDIVTYDSEPFAPRKNAVVLEKEHFFFGDRLTLLYRSERYEGWEWGALDINKCWGDAQPLLSAQYRIHTCQEELPDEEHLLKTLQDYLVDDDRKGGALLKKMDQELLRRREESLKRYDEALQNHTEYEEDPNFS